MNDIIQAEYTMPVQVASFDVGPDDKMTLSAILRYQQEVGERQLSPGGVGWKDLGEKGMAFVTSRWHGTVHRLPVMDEAVTVTTWHRERKGVRFIRCYQWHDAHGQLLMESVMQFALVSTADHRLLRGDEFEQLITMPAPPQVVIECADPRNFPLPEMTEAGVYTVRRSDLDRNGHMNNTHYGDLVGDFLPTALTDCPPLDIQMHFAGECRLGDTVTLLAGEDAQGAYVQGHSPRGVAFTARVQQHR